MHPIFAKLAVPVIAAPMFLVSGPQLVVETCKAGVVGTFPSLNQRTTEGYEQWLIEIKALLEAAERTAPGTVAPYGVNLIVHRSNPRLQADLEITVKHRVPIVITSLGAVKEVVDAVHAYGGVVLHDVTTVRFARSAASAGVDGLIAICAGAGGHAGTLSPFALVPEIRKFFRGTIILAGCMSSGASVAAARAIGADLAYLGTRFINTKESMASAKYQSYITESAANDIFYTPYFSGIPANFLAKSILDAGLNPERLKGTKDPEVNLGKELDVTAWRDVLSAGQGVGSVDDVIAVRELVARLVKEYRTTLEMLTSELPKPRSRL